MPPRSLDLRPPTNPKGFSLIETVVSLGIISFSVVGMLGLFPIGFKQASASMLETHGAQLAQEIMATLRTPPATNGQALLNRSTLESSATPVIFYASYPVSGAPFIGDQETDATLYTIEVRCQTMKPKTDATRVSITLFARNEPSERLHFQSIIGGF